MLRSGKLIGEFEYFAVAVPVLDNKFVFEVRSPFVKQPGEISFPGGKVETGEEPYATACRELEEELGITNQRFLYELDPLVTPFNYVIYPYVFQLPDSRMVLNPTEVRDVFLVPIELFLKPHRVGHVEVILRPRDDFPFDCIPGGQNYPWKKGSYTIFFFFWGEHVIWGLTARIAYEAANKLLQPDVP